MVGGDVMVRAAVRTRSARFCLRPPASRAIKIGDEADEGRREETKRNNLDRERRMDGRAKEKSQRG